MTVFIAHAPQDKDTAEALERFLERRGLFVELENGEQAFRPLQFNDTVVALVSKDSVFSPWRLRFEQRTLGAWAEQKLILVKLDHHFAPVGLRDLPFIDASFEAQREFAWGKVHKEIADQQMRARTPPPAPSSAPSSVPPTGGVDAEGDDAFARSAPQAPPSAPPQARGGGGLWAALFALALMLPGIAAGALIGAIWLVNRIGPAPGTFARTLEDVDAFGVRYGMAPGLLAPLALAALALAGAAFAFILARAIAALLPRRASPCARAKAAPAPQAEAGAEAERDIVFVSYARANAPLVLPVVKEIQKQGGNLWVDQDNLGGGESWAGEIVRAIRTAEGVCVMCSAAAFESDHVKREVYLADRYKKRLLPVFIEAAEPPEDFEYFFAGVQHLKLFETPEAERAAALSRAIGAA